MKPLVKLVIALAVVAVALGVWYGVEKKQVDTELATPVELSTGTVLATPRPLTDFVLENDTEKPFTPDNLRGHWSFLFFGFTNCHSICPTTMADLSKIYTLLPKDGKNPPQVILVTVDPKRDTPQALNKYVKSFNPEFIGVTGNEKDLERLRKELGIMVMEKNPDQVKGPDNLDHSGTIILLNPYGSFYAVFTMPHDPATIAADYKKIIENYPGN